MINDYLNYLNEANSLIAYDKELYDSIEKGDQSLPVNHPKGKFFTLLYNGKKAGIVGVILVAKVYFQIAIHQEFRRLGLVKIGSELIAKKFNLKELLATIDKNNIASFNAHKKAGFKEWTPSKDEYEELKKKKALPRKGVHVLVKYF